jgi:hypothetical protein
MLRDGTHGGRLAIPTARGDRGEELWRGVHLPRTHELELVLTDEVREGQPGARYSVTRAVLTPSDTQLCLGIPQPPVDERELARRRW